MSREFHLTLRPEPFWLQEAFLCMNEIPPSDDERRMNRNNESDGQQREELPLPYRNYRETMRARLQPVFAQYPLLTGYVEAAPCGRRQGGNQDSPILLFLAQMQEVLEAERLPEEAELETKLNRAFHDILEYRLPDSSGTQSLPEEQEFVINGLPDVMAALEKWNGTDADKFKLLRLYSERLTVTEQLWSLRESCAAIGRECLEPLRERFEAFLEELKKPNTVENLFQKIGVQCKESCSGFITPTVMPCSRILVRMKLSRENPVHYKVSLHLGIEALFPGQPAQDALHPDKKLLARLKALSDSTRLKILHQLAERPCYLQEMAKTLKLTPATVLHHLEILMAAELIELQVTSEKKKVYYQLREQGLKEASQGILLLAMPEKERETRLLQQRPEDSQSSGAIRRVIQK